MALLSRLFNPRQLPTPEEIGAIPNSERAVPNGVATLDAGGKLVIGQLPALAINETFVVNSQSAMLALAAQRGDIAIRTDLSKTYVLSTESPGTLSDWIEVLVAPAPVQSVDGKTGAVSLSGDYQAKFTNVRYFGGTSLNFDEVWFDDSSNTFYFVADSVSDKPVNNGSATIVAGKLRLLATGDASHTSTGHAFQIGDDAGANVIIDGNEIMARNNGELAELFCESMNVVALEHDGKRVAQTTVSASAPSGGTDGDVWYQV